MTGLPKDHDDDGKLCAIIDKENFGYVHILLDFDQPDGQKPGPSRGSVRIVEGIDDDLSEPSDTAKAGLYSSRCN